MTTGWSIWFIWSGLVDFYLRWSTILPAQPVLPISHHPKQNQAKGRTAQIKVNPTQLSDQMDPPVSWALWPNSILTWKYGKIICIPCTGWPNLLADLSWIDLDLGCSTGRFAVLQLRCCPSKTMKHLKSKSTQPSPRGDGSPCTALYWIRSPSLDLLQPRRQLLLLRRVRVVGLRLLVVGQRRARLLPDGSERIEFEFGAFVDWFPTTLR